MKMNADTFATIQSGVRSIMDLYPQALDNYTKAGKSARRYRWDLYHAACDRKLIDPMLVYRDGLNDSHLDTALRAITGTK
jgi:hypothetical protein